MKSKLGFIIQARSGSTRLPNKVLLPIYQEKGILEIIIDNLKTSFSNIDIIIATTTHPNDDHIDSLAQKKRIKCFRGDEHNVLNRMHEAAQTFGINYIVRICADNPMLNMEYISTLIKSKKTFEVDYISYKTPSGLPVIKSHFGIFAEIVSIKALKKALKSTNDPIYLEHVTNYIYEHDNEFKVELIPLPLILKHREDLRLTIDNKFDFNSCKLILSNLGDKVQKLETLINFVDQNKLNASMIEQIKKYQK